jgi:hypothetical protein
MSRYKTTQGPLYLALVLQVVILGVTFVGDYTRPLSIAAGCAAGSLGLLVSVIRDLRRQQE